MSTENVTKSACEQFLEYREVVHETLSKGTQDFITSSGARWYVSVGGCIFKERGFTSKTYANLWINSLGYLMDWRVRYLFKLRDHEHLFSIVRSDGEPIK